MREVNCILGLKDIHRKKKNHRFTSVIFRELFVSQTTAQIPVIANTEITITPQGMKYDGKAAERDVLSVKVVRKEMRGRVSRPCSSSSEANQLTGLCQTNIGAADAGFFILCQGLLGNH